MRRSRRSFALGLAAVLALAGGPLASVAPADVIRDEDVIALTGNEVGSGNGTLDLILFTESAGGSGNSTAGFNGDDGCTDMPTGSGTPSATESYVTSMGEVRDFFRLNYPDGEGGSTVHRIALFVDLNQTGATNVVLNQLDLVIDYDASFGDDRDDPAAADVTSRLQNSTGAGFSGGTLLASLDGPKTLPLNEQGGGWADYAIVIDVDPFDSAFTDQTRVLFHWSSTGHDDGGETIFLSGTHADVPEPAVLGLLAAGAGLLLRRRRQA